MSISIASLKHVYRRIVPRSIRDLPITNWLKRTILPHDHVYDADYYDRDIEGPAARSAPVIAETLHAEFKPKRVVDVGCGTGALLAAIVERGCSGLGLEYSDAGLAYCRRRGLDARKFDIENDRFELPRDFDLVVSTEVAEHLPERIADPYVDLLASFGSPVVFTAAPPGQEGVDHVNLQPRSYWIAKFEQRGFTYDAKVTSGLAETWKASASVESFYYGNLMVFRRKG